MMINASAADLHALKLSITPTVIASRLLLALSEEQTVLPEEQPKPTRNVVAVAMAAASLVYENKGKCLALGDGRLFWLSKI